MVAVAIHIYSVHHYHHHLFMLNTAMHASFFKSCFIIELSCYIRWWKMLTQCATSYVYLYFCVFSAVQVQDKKKWCGLFLVSWKKSKTERRNPHDCTVAGNQQAGCVHTLSYAHNLFLVGFHKRFLSVFPVARHYFSVGMAHYYEPATCNSSTKLLLPSVQFAKLFISEWKK